MRRAAFAQSRMLPARRQAQVAIEANHRYAPAWALRGKTEKAKGNYEAALADFQKALGYSPELTSVQLQIVDTYQKMGKPMRALSAVEQVLSRHSADQQPEQALVAKSIALINLEQLSPAIEVLEDEVLIENNTFYIQELFLDPSKSVHLASTEKCSVTLREIQNLDFLKI